MVETNLFVRALLNGPVSLPLIQAWKEAHFNLVTSEELLAELFEVLARPKFRRYFTREDVQELGELLYERAEVEEITEVVDTLRSDWITTGPKVRRFEEEFAAFIGAPAALALNSGTAALHIALATLGIGPDRDGTQHKRFDGTQHKDAVITTPMTFCSSVHVIEHVGATPILVDVEPDTLNIDPHRVEEALEQRSRGESRRF